MKNAKRFTKYSAGKRTMIAVFFLACALFSAPAQDLRDIAAVTVDYYFDNTYRVTVEDVFLARLDRTFSLQVKYTREDTADYGNNIFAIGPVINFSDNLYLDAIYGLKIDSATQFSHLFDVNLNYETDTASISFGIRGEFLTARSYYYFVPSVGGKFMLAEWLSLFNKIFLSLDSDGVVSGSYWGELGWIISPELTLRTGATLSWTGRFGYSILAGIDIKFSPEVLLKYNFQFLQDTIDYTTVPKPKYGIENALILDVKF
jgi:hypothetical protein